MLSTQELAKSEFLKLYIPCPLEIATYSFPTLTLFLPVLIMNETYDFSSFNNTTNTLALGFSEGLLNPDILGRAAATPLIPPVNQSLGYQHVSVFSGLR